METPSKSAMKARSFANLTTFWQTEVMKTKTPSSQRHCFPSEIISHAVSAHHRILVFPDARPASGQARHDSVAPVDFRVVAATQSPTVFIGFQKYL